MNVIHTYVTSKNDNERKKHTVNGAVDVCALFGGEV